MPIALSNPQNRFLRGLAHDLKPVLQVGAQGHHRRAGGRSRRRLEHHELIKVKVAAGDRELRDA